ncbi:FAD-binding oxidoreductase [Cryptosporangium arvum]|uniref:FAD/FMN-dependent dehydrogenase n=1 Tax=Cryptosporangium arvum DSM 44712 TaxID=927661 RepID=A0A010YND9_9ACTN|nr:FAD-binding oxidoreductase [Cryptosporangium arvum]EXG81695.1 FAD/FMN-dependent dehydrogenase [Cryptosporangium arvum DSM 44712]
MPALRPGSIDEAAESLRALGGAGTPVRPVGSGSRAGWGGGATGTELHTTGLNRILEHNPGDFTAVLECGVPLADAQKVFASAGQWLALDPSPGGTIGGLVATADSGPARHRYGGVRDLVIGVTLVLSDGTVARSGGKVIKNVAGYDLGKLFTGSFGTLGLVAEVAVRLHPLPSGTATAVATFTDPSALAEAASGLSRRPLEALSLDAAWRAGTGRLLVRFGGVTATSQASRVASGLAGGPEVAVVEDDEPLWEAQRSAQRSPSGAVLKVSHRPTELAAVVRAADAVGATVVSRAALGLSWLAFPDADPDTVATVREQLAPAAVTVLDGGDRVSAPWPDLDAGVVAVQQRVKARFDPARIFRPGTFVGGL